MNNRVRTQQRIADDDRQRLHHMLNYCRNMMYYRRLCRDEYAVFRDRTAVQRAAKLDLYLIGELSHDLSAAFKEETADRIPWPNIGEWADWRFVAPDAIDSFALWQHLTQHVPRLLSGIIEITKT